MTPTRFIFPSPGFYHYWTKGQGRKLAQKLDKFPEKEEIDKNLPLFFESDSLADAVIEEVYQNMNYTEATALIDRILEEGADKVAEAPDCLKKLFATMDAIPDWLDWEKVEAGAAFCRRSGIAGLIVLRDYCLMGGYESSAINKPLIFTGALKKGAVKRMAETIEFWVNATGEGALQRSSIGFRNTVKVRLMHAYARVSIKKAGNWDPQLWGEPINNWDMLATNLGFSIVFAAGLRKLGLRPSKSEMTGLLHFWKYIGYLLGIPAQYLPDNEEAAIRALYNWTITQPPADKDTQELARALMEEPYDSPYLKRDWQKRILVKIHLGYNYFFLQKRACETMGLPATNWRFYPWFIKIMLSVNEFFVGLSRGFRRTNARRGRKSQEYIKKLFLESYYPVK